VSETAPILRERVFQMVSLAGRRGMTCDETVEITDALHQTISPRFYELHTSGRIIDSGQRRKTRRGRNAIVYVVATRPTGQLELPIDRH